jgi:hypothetical protein
MEEEFTVNMVMTVDAPPTLAYEKSNIQYIYDLSADGKTLMVIETATLPNGDSRILKKVFDRTGS